METNFIAETKVSSKENKNRKGEVTSHSYSTAIPKPILNKFGLKKGTKLYWDIKDLNIIITPELPETQSIEAGFEILNDFLVNHNNHYGSYAETIILHLRQTNRTKEDIIETIVHDYKMINREEYKLYFKKVVLYFLDYPLNLPNQYEILNEVYNQITQTD